MGKFNEYTQKATPEDADSLMIYDAAAKANKLSPFSGIWNWIVEKLTNAVISNLQTNNKTVIGAINELNSKRPYVYSKATVDNTNPVTIELENYSTYLLFMQHDGGNNSMISAIMSEATQKITKITSSGDVFNATLKNQKLTITSTTTYWTYAIIKLS